LRRYNIPEPVSRGLLVGGFFVDIANAVIIKTFPGWFG